MMVGRYPEAMSDDEIVTFFGNFGGSATEKEQGYLEKVRLAPDKGYDLSGLSEDAVEKGSELRVHTFTFDVEDDAYLAEICPDGESGFVALDKFCRLFFVRYVQYGEGTENLGPWHTLEQAEQAFDHAVIMYDPG